MTDYEDFRSHILALDHDQEFQSETERLRAKALLSEVAEELPSYPWNYIAPRIARNMSIANVELENIALGHPEAIDKLSTAARDFALAWEALAKLREATTRETALLNAAINYELAGYQANAMCLAKKLSSDEPISPIIKMGALFLQRRLLQLRDLAQKTQIEPSTTNGITSALLEALALVLAGKAFSLMARFLFNGDRLSFDEALDNFQHASRVFASMGLVEETNLVDSIRSLLPVIEKRTTWTLLSQGASDRPKWRRYLQLLARGTGADVYHSRSISELWPSQVDAVRKGLLDDITNKIIKMPTSAGKTRVAELAMVDALVKYPGSKCVYIAPYRALVSELEQSFLRLFSDLGYRVSSITGSYESDDFEELLFRETSVIVTTPEKLDLLLRIHSEFLSSVRLFVIDEVHLVQDAQRGLKFELLLTRLKQSIPLARFLLLSAVIPQETLDDFADWFKSSRQQDVITSDWRPSVARYALFESVQKLAVPSVFQSFAQQSSLFESTIETGILRYVPEGEMQAFRSEEPPTVFHQQTYNYTDHKTRRQRSQVFPDMTNKAQIAAELAYKFAEVGPVLVFCTQPRYVTAVANALHERLKLTSRTAGHLPDVFQSQTPLRSAMLAREWLGDQPATSWLEARIGIHYGTLPDMLRIAVETDFREKGLPVLIATNTLAQGVNLPVKTVIIHSCRRYDPADGSFKRIPARDYWNIAGRAGRAGEETEGLTIHIKIDDKDRDDYNYYLHHRNNNVEPIKSILYKKLSQLCEERLSEEVRDNIQMELDAEVLALVVEESEELPLDQTVSQTLAESLMQIQAEKEQKYPIEKLHGAFHTVVHEVTGRVSSHDMQQLYSFTGLSSISCQAIHNHVQANADVIKKILVQDDELDNLIALLLPLCLGLPEIKPQRDFAFGGNYHDLLKQWIEGVDLAGLLDMFSEQIESMEDLGEIIDLLFEYRLPWGFAAYLRIAKSVLVLEDKYLPDKVRYLPSMVKFGLPDPMACWVMSSGIPFRATAMYMASAFRQEVPQQTYREFSRWLSDLDTERLYNDFGLAGSVLEDVSRAVAVSGVNPLLQDFTNLGDFLPRLIDVKGVSYNNRLMVALTAQIGQEVTLVRDYDNQADRNALIVCLTGRELGYIPRNVAQVLAPEIDAGADLDASVIRIMEGQTPSISIRVEKHKET